MSKHMKTLEVRLNISLGWNDYSTVLWGYWIAGLLLMNEIHLPFMWISTTRGFEKAPWVGVYNRNMQGETVHGSHWTYGWTCRCDNSQPKSLDFATQILLPPNNHFALFLLMIFLVGNFIWVADPYTLEPWKTKKKSHYTGWWIEIPKYIF